MGAYEIIHNTGLENYYRQRTEYAPKAGDDFQNPYEVWESRLPVSQEGFREGTFILEGVHCASCVWLNEKVLGNIDGVRKVKAQLATGRAQLCWDTSKTSLRKIAQRVNSIGYQLRYINPRKQNNATSQNLLKKMTVAGFFTGNIMLISISLYAGFFSGMDQQTRNLFHLTSWFMASITLFFSGSGFFKSAFSALKNRILSMDLLTSAGLSLAYFYSVYVTFSGKGEVFFDGVCFVTFAILLGRYLEARLREKAMTTVENLSRNLPQSVLKISNDEKEIETDIESILPDDKIIVRPDELLPLDAVLLSNEGLIDESHLTGEYLPVTRKKGDKIASGSRVIESPLKFKAACVSGQDTLSQISRKVDDALARESKGSLLAGKISRLFVGFVLLAGSATFFFWSYYLQAPMQVAVLHTVALLIVACPCALNLSIPTATLASMQKALQMGALLHSGQVFEELAGAKKIFLDKTGTLTTGSLQLIETIEKYNMPENWALQIAASLSRAAMVKHPVSKAFRKLDVSTLEVSNAKHFAGAGVQGTISGKDYFLGSQEFLSSRGIAASREKNRKEIYVYLAQTNRLLAIFLFKDVPRNGALSMVRYFQKFYALAMLTGDNEISANEIAKELEISTVLARRKPEQKTNIIQAAEKSIFMGDGLNDSEAIAAANVGVSFAEASQLSLIAADVLLLNNSLGTFKKLHALALRTRRIIRQNLVISFVYNVLLLPLAFMGVIVPLVGAIAMSASSIVVVLNSLRILRTKG